MTRDEAIQKAIKLLRLSQSSNPHEAALAAQRAQEILIRYDIDAAMLEDPQTPNPEPKETITDFGDEGTFLDKMKCLVSWKTRLAEQIASANGCQLYFKKKYLNNYDQRQTQTLCLIGRKSDVQFVSWLYQHCSQEIERFTRLNVSGLGKYESNQFRHGMVDTIGKRVWDARREIIAKMREEYQSNSLALVRLDNALVKLQQNSQEVQQWVKDNRKFRNQTISAGRSGTARDMGREAGHRVSLNRPFPSGGGGRKLIG